MTQFAFKLPTTLMWSYKSKVFVINRTSFILRYNALALSGLYSLEFIVNSSNNKDRRKFIEIIIKKLKNYLVICRKLNWIGCKYLFGHEPLLLFCSESERDTFLWKKYKISITILTAGKLFSLCKKSRE